MIINMMRAGYRYYW